MSRHLVESIISNNMLDASSMVEARLSEIRDCKLHEMKRIFAAEAFGRRPTPDEQRAAGRVRASDVHPDPRDAPMPGFGSKDKGKKSRKAAPNKKPEPSPEEPDKFGDLKPTPLKKDPRLRTMDRFRKTLKRYDTLKAKGSTTADARLRKIARGYAGKLAANATVNLAKGTGNAIKRFAKAPVMQDLKDIGFRNL